MKLTLSALIAVALLFGCASGQHVWNQGDSQPMPKLQEKSPARTKSPEHIRTEYARQHPEGRTRQVKAPTPQTAQVDFF